MTGNLKTAEFKTNSSISSTEADKLEAEDKLLRVVNPDVKARIRRIMTVPSHETHPYVLSSDDRLYISILEIEDPARRKQVCHLIRQCQIGAQVDLSSLPTPLHQLLRPYRTDPRRLVQSMILGGIVGTIVGVLAMAVSILAITTTELVLNASLNEFSGMQITAVSFVIFAVLGWIVATAFIWRRIKR